MRFHRISVLLLALSAPVAAGPAEEKLAIVEGLAQAFNQHDVDAMARYLTDDVQWMSVNGSTISIEADGKIVALVQGRMEIGPRALGGRSILADPRKAEMKDLVNERVKWREPWRPFAPSIQAERPMSSVNATSSSEGTGEPDGWL